jgi:hypothetical protein
MSPNRRPPLKRFQASVCVRRQQARADRVTLGLGRRHEREADGGAEKAGALIEHGPNVSLSREN